MNIQIGHIYKYDNKFVKIIDIYHGYVTIKIISNKITYAAFKVPKSCLEPLTDKDKIKLL